MQHPRREQAVRPLVRERVVEPVARGQQRVRRRTRPARAARTACRPCGRARRPASTRARCRARRRRCRRAAMNSSNCRCHASPSSATFAAPSVERCTLDPSGNAVAVGRSVFRYSSPSRSRSGFSSAYAGEPTQSGCQEEKTSCRKPGAVRPSTVLIAPPSQSFRSRTQTRQPSFASSAAPASELMPLPTKTASNPATRRLYSLDMSQRNRCDPPVLLREVEYARPSSVEEAIRLLGAHEGARALAGGQTLVNVMKARAASPDVLVDLNRLEELRAISVSGDTLQLGAMATYTQIMASSEVDVSRPILAEVAAQIADVQVRNRGTIGGNVCSNDPTNHLPPLLVALRASMTIRGEAGERTVPAEEFFLGVYMTVVGEGELLLSVSVPGRRERGRRLLLDHHRPRRNLPGERGRQPCRRLGANRARLCRRCSRPADPHEQRREQRPPGGRGGGTRSALRRARLRRLPPPPGRHLRGPRRRAGSGAGQVSARSRRRAGRSPSRSTARSTSATSTRAVCSSTSSATTSS